MDSTIKALAVLIIGSAFSLGSFLLVSAASSGRFHLDKYKQIDKRSIHERRYLLILGIFFYVISGTLFAYLLKDGFRSKPAPASTQQAPKPQPPATPRSKLGQDLRPTKESQSIPPRYNPSAESPNKYFPRKELGTTPQNTEAAIPPSRNEPSIPLPRDNKETTGAPYSFPGVE